MPNEIYFIAPNGKAYYCDKSGMQGAKEVFEFTKQMKIDLQAQTSLL